MNSVGKVCHATGQSCHLRHSISIHVKCPPTSHGVHDCPTVCEVLRLQQGLLVETLARECRGMARDLQVIPALVHLSLH